MMESLPIPYIIKSSRGSLVVTGSTSQVSFTLSGLRNDVEIYKVEVKQVIIGQTEDTSISASYIEIAADFPYYSANPTSTLALVNNDKGGYDLPMTHYISNWNGQRITFSLLDDTGAHLTIAGNAPGNEYRANWIIVLEVTPFKYKQIQQTLL